MKKRYFFSIIAIVVILLLVGCSSEIKDTNDDESSLPEDYSSKLAEFKTALSHISRQYARLSAFIEMGCMLDLISSVEFAELSDEISELAFS